MTVAGGRGDHPAQRAAGRLPAATIGQLLWAGQGITSPDGKVGHASQNILLQAAALGLAAVPVGSLDPSRVADTLALPPIRPSCT